jgi:hypothetical protein
MFWYDGGVDTRPAWPGRPRRREEEKPMFLMWYDNDRKKQARLKIEEAIERFVEKYGRAPTVVLVNPEEPVEGAPLPVVPRPTVARNFYWVGDEEVEPVALAGD